MTNEDRKKFIETIAPLIIAQGKARGYHNASCIIAQACCESAFGSSPSGNFNYFGMKCGGAWKGKSINLRTKEEYTPGTLTSIKDNFRVYDSLDEGIEGYFDFIAWSHYADLKKCWNYIDYAKTLKAKGYATSSTYVSTLCKIVQDWDLTQYDWEVIIIPDMKGFWVQKMQKALIAKGYSCGKWGADGDYGKATKEALGAFQADNNLDVDFKCGKLTQAKLFK